MLKVMVGARSGDGWDADSITFETFGPFHVFERLGSGGMATVHRATLEVTSGVHREVALKRLLPHFADNSQIVEQFINEAKLSASLHHPNIVGVHRLGQVDGVYYISMELVRGVDVLQLLRTVSKRSAALPIPVVLSILSDVCAALDYTTTGVGQDGEPLALIHRDLSPSNLVITDDGRVKLIDFGVAKSTSGRFATQSGYVKGKIGYMSAEALMGEPLDTRSDIYSVGVVGWELLTGERRFPSSDRLEILRAIRSGPIVPPSALNPSCPADLDQIILGALEIAREDRCPSAAILNARLMRVARRHNMTAGSAQVAAWIAEQIPGRLPSSTRFASASESIETTAGMLGDSDFEEIDDDEYAFYEITRDVPERKSTLVAFPP